VDEGSFERARFVFFTGSPQFVETNLAAALAAGAVAIDFTGKVSTKDQPSSPWFPKLDEFWSTPIGPKVQPNGTHFWIPSAAAVAATSLSFGLRPVGLKRLSITFLRPVSEAGREGIEELESQTGRLLSLQSVGKPVFNACREAGFSVVRDEDCTPSNVSAAGENTIQLGLPQSDPTVHGTWWFWGAADNVRLPAW